MSEFSDNGEPSFIPVSANPYNTYGLATQGYVLDAIEAAAKKVFGRVRYVNGEAPDLTGNVDVSMIRTVDYSGGVNQINSDLTVLHESVPHRLLTDADYAEISGDFSTKLESLSEYCTDNLTNISETSGDWDSVYASVSSVSAEWDSAKVLSDSVYASVETASGDWNAAFSKVAASSAFWDGSSTKVSNSSSKWDSVYSTVKNASGDWNDAANKEEWDSVYASVHETSADWDSATAKTQSSSADWDSVYSNVNSASADWVWKKGESDYTAILDVPSSYSGLPFDTENTAISPFGVAEGISNVAGLKGYRYTDRGNVSGHNYLDFEVNPSGWASGDVVSVVNKSKYENALTISSIDGSRVTFTTTLPFTSIISESDFDSYTAYVLKKPSSGNIDLGYAAHAEGACCLATNTFAHAEGFETSAHGQYSHAEGRETVAMYASHAEGQETKAYGERSHSEGLSSIATGNAAHAEGHKSEAANYAAHAEGASFAYGRFSHAEGYQTLARANTDNGKAHANHAEGIGTQAGYGALVVDPKEGQSGVGAHAEGGGTAAAGRFAHAEGLRTYAYGIATHAAGVDTTAYDNGAHSEGNSTYACGKYSHSEGESSKTTSAFTFSGAASTKTYTTSSAAQDNAHGLSVGDILNYPPRFAKVVSIPQANKFTVDVTLSTTAVTGNNLIIVNGCSYGQSSHVEGISTIAYNSGEHAQGQFNKSNKANDTFGNAGNTLHSIGIGSNKNSRMNAVEVMQDGSVFVRGIGGYDGTNPSGSASLSGKSAIWDETANSMQASSGYWNSAYESMPVPSTSTTPSMDGVAFIGVSSEYARADHRHPSDDSKRGVTDLGVRGEPTGAESWFVVNDIRFGFYSGTPDGWAGVVDGKNIDILLTGANSYVFRIDEFPVTDFSLDDSFRTVFEYDDTTYTIVGYVDTLASEGYVNSAVATNTANFLGTFDYVDDLHFAPPASSSGVSNSAIANALLSAVSSPSNNDYVFVKIDYTATTPEDEFRRFKFDGSDSVWRYEYTLNSASFTPAQWAAINSGITADKVAQIDSKMDGAAAYPAWEDAALYGTVGTVVSHKGRLWRNTEPVTQMEPGAPGVTEWTQVYIKDLKQDTLSSPQLSAVNSGATAEKVVTWDGYAAQIAQKANSADVNAALARKASLADLPYALVTPGEWEFSGSDVHSGVTYVVDETVTNGKYVYTLKADGVAICVFDDDSSVPVDDIDFADIAFATPGVDVIAARTGPHLLDRAVNAVSVTGGTTLTLPDVNTGKSRDFYLKMTVTGSQQVSFSPSTGITYTGFGNPAKTYSAGTYLLHFAETAENEFCVTDMLAEYVNTSDLPYAIVTAEQTGGWITDSDDFVVRWNDSDSNWILLDVTGGSEDLLGYGKGNSDSVSLTWSDDSDFMDPPHAAVTATRAYALADRAVNAVSISADAALEFPAKTAGKVRDFAVRLSDSGSHTITVAAEDAGGDTVTLLSTPTFFDGGVFSFTEVAQGDFVISEPFVQVDWNETANTSPAFIKNKPNIPAAQVNSDWDSLSGISQILNKPSPYASSPEMDGTASPGTVTAYALGDHRHPSDTSKADKSDVEPLLFKQWYPDGSVTSSSQFTQGLKYEFDTTNHTASVKPFCNTGDSDNDNSGIVGDVVIPPYVESNGVRYVVSSVLGTSGVADYNESLTSIKAPTTVKSIGDYAFDYCTSLTSVSLSSATSIGGRAFSSCESLSSVSLPSVTSVGGYAFDYCGSLSSVSLPSATSIGGSAFDYCGSLTSVSLPSVTSVGGYAFDNCASITLVDFGKDVRVAVPTLGSDAFNGVATTHLTFVVPDSNYNAWIAASGWVDLYNGGAKFYRHSEWEAPHRYELDYAMVTPETTVTIDDDWQFSGSGVQSGVTYTCVIYEYEAGGETVYIASLAGSDGTNETVSASSLDDTSISFTNSNITATRDCIATVQLEVRAINGITLLSSSTNPDTSAVTVANLVLPPSGGNGRVRDMLVRMNLEGTGDLPDGWRLNIVGNTPSGGTQEAVTLETEDGEMPSASERGSYLLSITETVSGSFAVSMKPLKAVQTA